MTSFQLSSVYSTQYEEDHLARSLMAGKSLKVPGKWWHQIIQQPFSGCQMQILASNVPPQAGTHRQWPHTNNDWFESIWQHGNVSDYRPSWRRWRVTGTRWVGTKETWIIGPWNCSPRRQLNAAGRLTTSTTTTIHNSHLKTHSNNSLPQWSMTQFLGAECRAGHITVYVGTHQRRINTRPIHVWRRHYPSWGKTRRHERSSLACYRDLCVWLRCFLGRWLTCFGEVGEVRRVGGD